MNRHDPAAFIGDVKVAITANGDADRPGYGGESERDRPGSGWIDLLDLPVPRIRHVYVPGCVYRDAARRIEVRVSGDRRHAAVGFDDADSVVVGIRNEHASRGGDGNAYRPIEA